MTERSRLIEVAFPLKQTSLDSVHEKNVRHGHISTLHIWPARRPLAACRAALIATLLPDPGDPEERKEILERLAGHVVRKVKRKKLPDGRFEDVVTEETEGGILHWGRESGPDLEWFREKIKAAYGGRAPKVLDPFAGGGAIPLEAMRLGCEATAVDINPVAWFILKCTLEYPQKLAGQKRPLPDFALHDRGFMAEFLAAQGLKGKALDERLEMLGLTAAGNAALFDMGTGDVTLEADLAWHVRAWGRWVLAQARRELAPYYPTYADFQPLTRDARPDPDRGTRLVPLREDGIADIDTLNAEFAPPYLANPGNSRWVAKPTVAYLWARTVKCKNCRATIPLLKTRWLCKKDNKRVLLTMEPNGKRTGVTFGIQDNVPVTSGGLSQRLRDQEIGAGTMSRSGATCPCCGSITTMEGIRVEGQAGGLEAIMTTVITEGDNGKEYRLPHRIEVQIAVDADEVVGGLYETIPFGLPNECITEDAKRNTWCVQYGIDQFSKVFTKRQLLSLGQFVKKSRLARHAMKTCGYPADWVEAVGAYCYSALARLADRSSTVCTWQIDSVKVRNTFGRFALPVAWDFVEVMPWADASGGYGQAVHWIGEVVEHLLHAELDAPIPHLSRASAITLSESDVDVIITDPPYYDSIGYSVLMDFFYVWLRRTVIDLTPATKFLSAMELAPKWDHAINDGELVDDASRFSNDRARSRSAYEDGMALSFQACHRALAADGRLVIVFAHKRPDAWGTLVSAVIRAGFVVNGSWPIQTERVSRTRSLSSAALSSSVWLVCKKRPESARPGWDNKVLEEIRANIRIRLHDFWDAGIRGPDFVWAATGPALEAYSRYPVVKKANEPGQTMSVSEFLGHVRRMVVDFVVGRVLTGSGGTETTTGLDDATTYYLLHRNDFGMNDMPAGACILYAVSCGLSDHDLAVHYDLLVRSGGRAAEEAEADDAAGEDEDAETTEGSGSAVRLKPWQQRKHKNLGYEGPGGRPAPLIDQVHQLMHLWRAGDVTKVDDYVDARGLRLNALFGQLLQALIELAAPGSEERALLESISNHIGGRGGSAPTLFDRE